MLMRLIQIAVATEVGIAVHLRCFCVCCTSWRANLSFFFVVVHCLGDTAMYCTECDRKITQIESTLPNEVASCDVPPFGLWVEFRFRPRGAVTAVCCLYLYLVLEVHRTSTNRNMRDMTRERRRRSCRQMCRTVT